MRCQAAAERDESIFNTFITKPRTRWFIFQFKCVWCCSTWLFYTPAAARTGFGLESHPRRQGPLKRPPIRLPSLAVQVTVTTRTRRTRVVHQQALKPQASQTWRAYHRTRVVQGDMGHAGTRRIRLEHTKMPVLAFITLSQNDCESRWKRFSR